MGRGIRISEKHGVNPSLGLCFWCGKDNGEIVLVGRLPGDKEAPKRACYTYEPCDVCKKRRALGIAFIEAKSEPCVEGQPSIDGNADAAYPTGNWLVITENGVKKMLDDQPDLLKRVLAVRKAVISPEVFSCFEIPGATVVRGQQEE